MRIIFSIYEEDRISGQTKLLHRSLVTIELSIEYLTSYLELYEGFRYNLVLGKNLSFWDIYCFWDISDSLIKKIDTIPQVSYLPSNKNECTAIIIQEFNPGTVNSFVYPEKSKVFLYSLNRFECGAGSYSSLVYWMAENPIYMIFIAGIIYDIFKYFGLKLLSLFKPSSFVRSKRKIIYFNPNKFYKKFTELTHIKEDECQIIKLDRMRTGHLLIEVRTLDNDYYNVRCSAKGKILELKSRK